MMRVSVILITLSVLFQAAWISAKHIKGSKKNVGVYGGETIGIEDAPWMALVYTSEKTPCGGTIINPRFVLTIDTCCYDQGRPRSHWYVRVASDGRSDEGISVKIQDIYPYNKTGIDILKPFPCLLKLEKPLKYNQKTQQANLNEPSIVIENGTIVDFVAFGRPALKDANRGLRRTKLPIDDTNWCKADSKRLYEGVICAGNHEHNACAGDAGGALTSGRNLIGVLSTVPGDCYSNPSRFCRISHFRPWISDIMAKNK